MALLNEYIALDFGNKNKMIIVIPYCDKYRFCHAFFA